MQNPVNALRGVTRIEVSTPYPERFINLCAAKNIPFWNSVPGEASLRVDVHSKSIKKLSVLSRQHNFELKRLSKAGVPVLLKRFRRRVALILAIIAVVAALRISAFYIWEIVIYGNEKISSVQILTALDEFGFNIGVFAPTFDTDTLKQQMLAEIPELEWIAINTHGSRAEVLVREAIPKPELLDRNTATDIVASKSGTITNMLVLDGTASVIVGSQVEKGDTLIAHFYNRGALSKSVHALGKVEARTKYKLVSSMPLETTIKHYTGETAKQNRVFFGDAAVSLYYKPASDINCDKVITQDYLTLPGGSILPIALSRCEYIYYEPETIVLSEAAAADLLKAGLEARLKQETGDGKIAGMNWDIITSSGVTTVTLTAEAIEQIGVERKR